MRDGDLRLVLISTHPGDAKRRLVPAYKFEMRKVGTRERMGHLHLRIGSARILRCPGHIGYGLDPEFRGNHYAARSVHLVLPFAAANGIKVVWTTCKPKNAASRRTNDLAGLKYVETIRVPGEHRMYAEGYRYLRRYRLSLKRLSNQSIQRTRLKPRR